jgi:typhasterol/6-deoxotyphasterol 2alpha-hydroxylase
MELALATWAALLGIVAALFLLRGRRRGYNPPPGPKPWPIVGNLNLIMGELPHRSMNELSKRYGPLMQLWFGSLPVVVGASAEMAKLFLKTNDAAFADRPRFAVGKYTAYDCSDILWAPLGPYLRQARRICAAELFSAKRLESLEHIRDEEVRVMLQQLRQATGRTVQLGDYLQTMTLGVISRIVLGRKYVVQEEGNSAPPVVTPAEFREMVDEFFVLHGAFNIGDFIPWLDWLDLQGYVARMKRMNARFGRFLEHVLDVHNERRLREGGSFVPKDMVDVLLQLADDTILEVQLSRDNVKAITQVTTT